MCYRRLLSTLRAILRVRRRPSECEPLFRTDVANIHSFIHYAEAALVQYVQI